jgi:hypothetical protein
MTDQLRNALDAAYAAFAMVPKPRTIEGCPCCIDDKEIAILLSKPVREIAPVELSSYASSVFLTVGSEADFRYFLPRILEILVTNTGWWPDPEVFGRSLANAKWLGWLDKERAAVEAVFEAQFQALLDAHDGFALDSWLCGLSRAGVELASYLAKLAAAPAAVLAYYEQNADKLDEGTLGNAFWDDDPHGGMKQIVEWFRSLEISLIVLEAYGVDLSRAT